jgi:uncharacterized membrane protein (UPF0127 family)
MKIINQTKQTLLAKQVVIPKSLLNQSLGLLKYKNPVAMILSTHFGIHTFGMHYAIDVLILDNDNFVVATKQNLKPNRIFLWNWKYKSVLELPARTIERSKTEIGDTIIFSVL